MIDLSQFPSLTQRALADALQDTIDRHFDGIDAGDDVAKDINIAIVLQDMLASTFARIEENGINKELVHYAGDRAEALESEREGLLEELEAHQQEGPYDD